MCDLLCPTAPDSKAAGSTPITAAACAFCIAAIPQPDGSLVISRSQLKHTCGIEENVGAMKRKKSLIDKQFLGTTLAFTSGLSLVKPGFLKAAFQESRGTTGVNPTDRTAYRAVREEKLRIEGDLFADFGCDLCGVRILYCCRFVSSTSMWNAAGSWRIGFLSGEAWETTDTSGTSWTISARNATCPVF